MENWKIGKVESTVITDSTEGLSESTGHAGKDAFKFYGGNLICESIWRKKDAHLIASAPKMLEALENIENDSGKIPDHVWKMIKKAIASAKGEK